MGITPKGVQYLQWFILEPVENLAMRTEAKTGPGWHRQAWALVVIGLMVLLGLFAKHMWTRFANMAIYAKRSEAVRVLEQIQQAELQYFEEHGDYVAAGPTPHRAPGRSQTPFESEHMDGWKRLGWQPDSLVRCQFEVTVPTPTDFRAEARCDVDGDGQMSVFVSSREHPPKRITPDDQY
jgi:hypothetical protein